ncbi:MAG: DNA translocase FtsK [Anaerolineae bacterium]
MPRASRQPPGGRPPDDTSPDHDSPPAQDSAWDRLGEPTLILGATLLVVGLITLVSLLAISHGSLTDAWAGLVRLSVGWAALPLALFVAVSGGWLLTRRWHGQSVAWDRVLWGELIIFGALALLSAVGFGDPLDRALAGQGGGMVGFALVATPAEYIGRWPSALLWLLVIVVAAFAITRQTPRSVWRAASAAVDRLRPPAREDEADEADDGVLEMPTIRPHAPAQATAAVRATPTPAPAPVPDDDTLAVPPFMVAARAAAAKAQQEAQAPPPAAATTPAPGEPEKRARKGKKADAAAAPEAATAQIPMLPGIEMLEKGSKVRYREDEVRERSRIIEETLSAFGVPAKVVTVNQGPTVTQYGVEPGYMERKAADGTVERRKVKVSRIAALSNDLALALAASAIRIEAPVPGKSVVGIEVPNANATRVALRNLMESPAYQTMASPLRLALGEDVRGAPVVADLGRMPHLLIAGATGSGKSVCLNTIIACLLFNNTPESLQLVLVDPKRVELIGFNGVPHLMGPVVVEMDEVIGALKWLTREMERRYQLFAALGVRNIGAYNDKVRATVGSPLPYIVIIIDELADLMMVAPDEAERLICRLAQLARATGIHLILATQRPSTDVVTGLIKANFPARIAFAVSSGVDSRVILDSVGADKLLGRGDMLYLAPDAPGPQRLQGAYVTDRELEKLVKYWRKLNPHPNPDVQAAPWEGDIGDEEDSADEQLIEEAIAVVRQSRTASASFLQRRLRIGYPRAARLMDELEERGVVGPAEAGRSRKVLIGPEDVDVDMDTEIGALDQDDTW